MYFRSVRTQVFHDFVPLYESVLAGADGGEEEATQRPFKNTILRCKMHCLISSILFLWSNFMVFLQLLGRTVGDCLS